MGKDRRAPAGALAVILCAVLVSVLPVDVETSPGRASEGCEECHEAFVPFKVVAVGPSRFVDGEDVKLECRVRSGGQHEVVGLVAELVGLPGQAPSVEEEDFSGSVSRLSGSAHGLNVEDGAVGLVVTMTEDPGPLGQGDAMLTLRTPDGGSFTSNSGGAEEEIVLDGNQTASAGSGGYEIAVDQVGGLRPVSYAINVKIDYRDPDIVKDLGDIGPGDETTGVWELSLTREEARGLKVRVTGTVRKDHDDEEREEEYTVERVFRLGGAAEEGTEATFEVKPYRNGLGYVLIGLLLASLFTGFPRTRKLIPGLRGKAVLRVHCIISWLILMVIAVHAYLASLTHPWWSPAVITGEAMTVVFLILSAIPTVEWFKGGFRKGLFTKFGRERIMLVNRVAVVVVLVVLAVHIYA